MDPGKTILNLDRIDGAGLPRGDVMLRAVREAAAGVYDLLGELGRNRYGSIVYLGRELATGNLSALRLDVAAANPNELELSVVGELDDSVPALGYECHYCGQQLDTWGRFCTTCGRDVSGVVTAITSSAERQQLLEAVQAAAAGEYEILGEMKRARGGGIVYFARELKSGQISALRLQRDTSQGPDAEYSLGKTQVLKPLVEAVDADAPVPRRDPAPVPDRQKPNDYVGPVLADGRVSDVPAPPPPPPPPPPVQPDKRLSTKALLIGGIAVILVLAIAAIAVSTNDAGQGLVVNKDTTQPKDTTPSPPPAPVDPPPEPPVVAVDTAVLEVPVARLPEGAQLLVDGVRWRGGAVRLAVGRHTIENSAPGYVRRRQTVEVTSGQRQLPLRWVPAPDTNRTVVTRPPTPEPQPPSKSPCVVATETNNWAGIRQACLTDARAGNHAAMRSLAVALLRGGAADEAEAVTWLDKSAEAGNRDSQYDLGTLYLNSVARKNERRAFENFTLAGKAGHSRAQFQLGRMYEKGIGISKSEVEALRWFQESANQGYAPAQAGVGVFYLKGIGTRRDDAKAKEWLQKGADGGSAPAMYNLGTMYLEGRAGLPKSRDQARYWIKKAADLGDAEAKKALKGL